MWEGCRKWMMSKGVILWQPRRAERTCSRYPSGLDISHVNVCIKLEIILIGRRCFPFNEKKVIQNHITMSTTRSTYNLSQRA